MIYGHDRTIHHTTHLDVETFHGKVVSVWFRCMALPFEQHETSVDRAREMRVMSKPVNKDLRLVAVEVLEPKENPAPVEDWRRPPIGGYHD